MAAYFDASAFFPIFIDDKHSSPANARLRTLETDFATSDLTIIETSSAASRAVRSRRISEEDARVALDKARHWAEVNTKRHEVARTDFTLADEYVRRFDLGLRPADALHVALCRRLGLTLLTCDVAQAKAARMLGVEAIDLLGGSS